MNGASLRLRTALVGCGYWGRNYLRLLGELSSVELVGVAESEPRRRQELAAANPSIAVASSLEELIAGNGRIDAVVVATEATAHEPVIRAALEAGCHVLAEKPLTLKASAGEELCRLAESRGAILMVGHTFLFNTAVWRLRELIQESRVGRIYYLHASRTHLGPIREDVDAIWDLAAHDISMFDYLVGARPSTVSAVAADYLRPGRHDVAFITLQYPGGVLGHVQISWLDANKERRLAIVGERCRIVFDDLNNLEKIRIYEKGIAVQRAVDSFGEFQYLLRDGDIISPKLNLREPLRVQVEEFLGAVRERRPPVSDGWTGVEIVRTLEAVQHSATMGGAPVTIRSE